jgi:hypothetical protein
LRSRYIGELSYSANRDTALTSDPERLDLTRPARTRTWRSATASTAA